MTTNERLEHAERLLRGSRFDNAERAFLEILSLADPADIQVQAYCGLGDAFQARKAIGRAIEAYGKALEVDSGSTRAWWGIGSAFALGNEQAAAMECFQRLAELLPNALEPRHNLGKALFALGDVDAALDAFHKAIAIEPNPLSIGMTAVIIPGSPRATLFDILECRRAWASTLPQPTPPSLRPCDPSLPIRVGYVSSFFSQSHWMKPVWALINHHDRDRFEVTLVSDHPLDAIGPEYRRDPRDRFLGIYGLDNNAAASLIRGAELDVLVDLNAFSKFERLPLFALRPAPVLVQWFALFATSGMTCFDALIGDSEVIAEGDQAWFTEPLVTLDGSYMTFEVGYPVPDVVASPCLAGHPFMFGCLAPQYKITPEVLRAWGTILKAAPSSRLILKSTALASEGTRRYLQDQIKALGIDPIRVSLEGPSPHREFLETYNKIDAVLDTFPYNGGTTTTEAIWQGVPVLTFRGDRWIGRISASILHHAGLDDYIAPNLEAHIDQAIKIANDPESPRKLASLRNRLRDSLRKSPVCEAQRFARSIESVYETILKRRWATDSQSPISS